MWTVSLVDYWLFELLVLWNFGQLVLWTSSLVGYLPYGLLVFENSDLMNYSNCSCGLLVTYIVVVFYLAGIVNCWSCVLLAMWTAS